MHTAIMLLPAVYKTERGLLFRAVRTFGCCLAEGGTGNRDGEVLCSGTN